MPTTSVEKLSPTRAKLTISVTPEELKPSIAHAYEHIAEQINVPGFRKGKVPAPIIDQRIGRVAVLEHAVSEGLDTFYREAAAAHELRVLGRPQRERIALLARYWHFLLVLWLVLFAALAWLTPEVVAFLCGRGWSTT